MKTSQIQIFLLITFIILAGCKKTSRQYLLFNYNDFGPQSMAWETIGMQWWQWDSHGDCNPDKKYDIKIVVYNNISLAEIKILFPVNQKTHNDFRYITYNKSIAYLNRSISETDSINEDWAVNLKKCLTITRDIIVNQFNNNITQTQTGL